MSSPSTSTAMPAPSNMQQAPAESLPVAQAKSSELRGQLMTEEDRTAQVQAPERPSLPVLTLRDLLWPAVLFFLLIGGWRWSGLRQERSYGERLAL